MADRHAGFAAAVAISRHALESLARAIYFAGAFDHRLSGTAPGDLAVTLDNIFSTFRRSSCTGEPGQGGARAARLGAGDGKAEKLTAADGGARLRDSSCSSGWRRGHFWSEDAWGSCSTTLSQRLSTDSRPPVPRLVVLGEQPGAPRLSRLPISSRIRNPARALEARPTAAALRRQLPRRRRDRSQHVCHARGGRRRDRPRARRPLRRHHDGRRHDAADQLPSAGATSPCRTESLAVPVAFGESTTGSSLR